MANVQSPTIHRESREKTSSFKKRKQLGHWVKYDSDGRIKAKLTFEIGKLSGAVTKYKFHSNGQIESQETWKDDEKHAPWVFYNKSGGLDKEKPRTLSYRIEISDGTSNQTER